jgi:hypothetical protein
LLCSARRQGVGCPGLQLLPQLGFLLLEVRKGTTTHARDLRNRRLAAASTAAAPPPRHCGCSRCRLFRACRQTKIAVSSSTEQHQSPPAGAAGAATQHMESRQSSSLRSVLEINNAFAPALLTSGQKKRLKRDSARGVCWRPRRSRCCRRGAGGAGEGCAWGAALVFCLNGKGRPLHLPTARARARGPSFASDPIPRRKHKS